MVTTIRYFSITHYSIWFGVIILLDLLHPATWGCSFGCDESWHSTIYDSKLCKKFSLYWKAIINEAVRRRYCLLRRLTSLWHVSIFLWFRHFTCSHYLGLFEARTCKLSDLQHYRVEPLPIDINMGFYTSFIYNTHWNVFYLLFCFKPLILSA